MSRADKRRYQANLQTSEGDASVRLFAFSNTRPGYKVVFSPEEPIIILKTKQGASEQHPCAQWEPFSSLAFSTRPNTIHAIYVADTTPLSSKSESGTISADQAEITSGILLGPILRRLSNVLSKLNPHHATMIAAGASCYVALKYVLLGEKLMSQSDRLVKRLVLLCPLSLTPIQNILNLVLRHSTSKGEHAKPEIFILAGTPEQKAEWLALFEPPNNGAGGSQAPDFSSLFSSVSVTCDLTPSIFAALARESGIVSDGTTVDPMQRYPHPQIYRIDFFLSRETKQVEQAVVPSPLDSFSSACPGDDLTPGLGKKDSPAEGPVEWENASSSDVASNDSSDCLSEENNEAIGKPYCVSNLSNLQHLRGPANVILECRLLDLNSGLVGSTEGCILVDGLAKLLEEHSSLQQFAKKPKRNSPALRIEASIHRNRNGCTRLSAYRVLPLTVKEEKKSMTIGPDEQIPRYNFSSISFCYGALLVRGRKCALARDLTGKKFKGMRLPYACLDNTNETAIDCAVRALCDACDVSPDNFYIPHFISPVSYYPISNSSSSERVCVTIYVVVANLPPPRGVATDNIEDDPEPEESYDWCSYQSAMNILQTEEERVALTALQQNLRVAFRSGMFEPLPGLGIFGDPVKPRAGAISSGGETSTALPIDDSVNNTELERQLPKDVSFQGFELLLIVAPGCTNEEETSRKIGHEMRAFSLIQYQGNNIASDFLERAVAQEVMKGRNALTVYIHQGVDLEELSLGPLTQLKEDRGVCARFFTLLLRDVTHTHLDAVESHGREDWLSQMIECCRFSDALVVADEKDDFSASELCIMKLAICINPDITVLSGILHSKPVAVDTIAPTRNSDSPQKCLYQSSFTYKGNPFHPKRVSKLFKPGALSFLKADESTILWIQGELWIASRPRTNAYVWLDLSCGCLSAEEGDEWTEEQDQALRSSTLQVYAWSTETSFKALESAIENVLEPMLWSSPKDGSDWTRCPEKDSLPKW